MTSPVRALKRRKQEGYALTPHVSGDTVTFTYTGNFKPTDEGHVWITVIGYEDGIPIYAEDHGADDGATWTVAGETSAAYLWVFPDAGTALATCTF
jgi:hypothetical protein